MEMYSDARGATDFHEADQLDQGLANSIDGPDQYLVDLTTVDRVNQRQFAGAAILLHCGRTVGEHLSYRPSAFAGYRLQPLDLILVGEQAIW